MRSHRGGVASIAACRVPSVTDEHEPDGEGTCVEKDTFSVFVAGDDAAAAVSRHSFPYGDEETVAETADGADDTVSPRAWTHAWTVSPPRRWFEPPLSPRRLCARRTRRRASPRRTTLSPRGRGLAPPSPRRQRRRRQSGTRRGHLRRGRHRARDTCGAIVTNNCEQKNASSVRRGGRSFGPALRRRARGGDARRDFFADVRERGETTRLPHGHRRGGPRALRVGRARGRARKRLARRKSRKAFRRKRPAKPSSRAAFRLSFLTKSFAEDETKSVRFGAE